jgi:phage major head subunit gpT-like protein
MPTIITPQLLGSVTTGFKMSFNQGFDGVASSFKKVAMLAPSDSAEEVYPWLAATPGLREWIGPRLVKNLGAGKMSIVNRKFEDTVGVERTHIEDDKIGLYGPMFAMMGEAAAELPDELVWDLVKAGFSTLSWDGQYFFDTDHPGFDEEGQAVSVSNFGGGAGTPWLLFCTKKVRKPFIYQKRTEVEFVAKDKKEDDNVFGEDRYLYGTRVRCAVGFGFHQACFASKQDLTADNFNALYAAMSSQKKENGKAMNMVPDLLVVPPSLRAAAELIVEAQQVNGTTNTNYRKVDLHVEPRLA